MNNATPERFSRTARLLGETAMARLRSACVTVVGLGAVGGYALEALARSGVGALRLVDMDEVRPTNLNRQLLATEVTLGRPKVEVARERVLSIHPDCRVETLAVFAHVETFPQILAGPPDAVVDAIDSFTPKRELIAAAAEGGIPIVSSMGAALRRDASAIRVADLSETRHCPLARLLRKRLRRKGVTTGVRCVYSEEIDERGPGDDAEAHKAREEEEEGALRRGRPRKTLGSLPTIPALFGLLAAHEVLKILCGDSWE